MGSEGSAYVRLEYRRAMEIAVVGAGAAITLNEDGTVAKASVALTAVGPTILEVTGLEELLVGTPLDDLSLSAVAMLASDQASPISDLRASEKYRRHTVGVMAKRALEAAGKRAAGETISIPVNRAQGIGAAPNAAARLAAGTKRGSKMSNQETSQNMFLNVNGVSYPVSIDAGRNLLSVLRGEIGLTGTKEGCDDCECGACMVLLDGQPVNSCSYLAAQTQGREITTIEGIAPSPEQMDPLQANILEAGGVQCGFCTPGMILSARALLERNASPSEEEVRIGLSGNLCRCTGYARIVEAVQRTAGSDSMESPTQ